MIARIVAAAAALTLIAPAAPASADTTTEDVGSALAVLDTIPVKGRAPKTGYSRAQFGEAWTDDVSVEFGHNGCSTRNDILRRDLVDIVTKLGTNGCVVVSGVLNDPYTAASIDFVRGDRSSELVQIDHIVPLSNAWQTGAQLWDELKRRDFANDPRNLQATDGPTNQAKGDGDVATWLPPNKSYRCTYVARIVTVKAIYGLWATQPEHDAMARILSNCTG
jgi:hypothetical protein